MSGFEIERLLNKNSLVFSSPEFLFWFLPVILIVFYLTPVKFRAVTLFVGSILLYACCEPFFVLLLLAVTVLNYLTGKYMDVGEDAENFDARVRKFWFVLSVAVNAGILIFFKVGNVISQNLLLPLGISFYSFKMISYQADVYRGKIPAERDLFRLGAYLCMFPQITSGPVMRYEDGYMAVCGKKISVEMLEEGFRLLALGLAAKVLLADQLGMIWNDIQTIGFESVSTPLAWFGAIAYSLQLYLDFQGYSLMAVGIGVMLGFPYMKNFDQPYMATSISGFWRRWHITLGAWFRDYVYIPLGGNRKGAFRNVCNLVCVWLLTGLWHGNGINFVIWGLTVGLLIVLEKLFYGRWMSERKILSHLYVWFLIPLTWMVFAIEDVNQMEVYFGRLFPFFGIGETLNEREIFQYFETYGILMFASLICCVPALEKLYQKWKHKLFVSLFLLILFWIAVYKAVNMANNPFMYFRF